VFRSFGEIFVLGVNIFEENSILMRKSSPLFSLFELERKQNKKTKKVKKGS